MLLLRHSLDALQKSIGFSHLREEEAPGTFSGFWNGQRDKTRFPYPPSRSGTFS